MTRGGLYTTFHMQHVNEPEADWNQWAPQRFRVFLCVLTMSMSPVQAHNM